MSAAPQPAGKTYVLLHGAWHGGWCWRPVAEGLQARGHRVFTPTQTGLGERSHLLSRDITLDVFVADLANVFESEDLADVVLVGHSFGGLAISGVADRMPERILHLVYLDSLILEDGRALSACCRPRWSPRGASMSPTRAAASPLRRRRPRPSAFRKAMPPPTGCAAI